MCSSCGSSTFDVEWNVFDASIQFLSLAFLWLLNLNAATTFALVLCSILGE